MKEKIKNEYAVKNGFDDWDDLLCNALPDFGRFAINEVMDIFVNQEVEKRIAERMPSEEDAQNAESEYEDSQNEDKIRFETEYCFRDFMAGTDWLRSRLTNPGVNDSQKTEGGEG
jgi:hypothetical protein